MDFFERGNHGGSRAWLVLPGTTAPAAVGYMEFPLSSPIRARASRETREHIAPGTLRDPAGLGACEEVGDRFQSIRSPPPMPTSLRRLVLLLGALALQALPVLAAPALSRVRLTFARFETFDATGARLKFWATYPDGVDQFEWHLWLREGGQAPFYFNSLNPGAAHYLPANSHEDLAFVVGSDASQPAPASVRLTLTFTDGVASRTVVFDPTAAKTASVVIGGHTVTLSKYGLTANWSDAVGQLQPVPDGPLDSVVNVRLSVKKD